MIRSYEQRRFVTFTRALVAAVLTGGLLAGGALSALASDSVEQQQLVDKAQVTLQNLFADPSVGPALRDSREDTKALFIVPQFIRGSFIFGGAGGSGVLLV
ncbi:MAG TPA: hypothetical protein VIT63_03500, partial [Nitrospira sp.]